MITPPSSLTGPKVELPNRGCPTIPVHVFNPSFAPVNVAVSDVPPVPVAVMVLFRAFSFLCSNAVSLEAIYFL